VQIRRAALYALVGLGGVAALSWEVLWQLEISIAVGISALGTAITLATLMGGMTAGALLTGRWIRAGRVRSPLRLYGLFELAIGISGLLLKPSFALLEVVDARVYQLVPAGAPLVHLLGLVAILAVPTLAMGASMPCFRLVATGSGTSLGYEDKQDERRATLPVGLPFPPDRRSSTGPRPCESTRRRAGLVLPLRQTVLGYGRA